MPHRSTLRGRVWKLTDLWTQRTRPQILAKPQNGFAQAPTRLIAILFHKNPKTRTPLGFSGQLPTDSAEEAKILERHTDRGHITSSSLRTTILTRRRREEVSDVGALLCSFGNPELHPFVLDRLSHR